MDFDSYLTIIADLLRNTQATSGSGAPLSVDEAFRSGAAKILDVKQAGRTILVAGNGGSAAIASHIRTDLANAIKVRAHGFTDEALLTCLSNDFGYRAAFEHQAALWAEAGDMIIAVSSSGKSENILRAVKACQERGAYVLSMTGFRADNSLRSMGDLNFYIGSEDFGYVESAHALLAHYLTDYTLSLIGEH